MSEFLEREEEEVFISFSMEDKTWWGEKSVGPCCELNFPFDQL
jgi:hypothetical protein